MSKVIYGKSFPPFDQRGGKINYWTCNGGPNDLRKKENRRKFVALGWAENSRPRWRRLPMSDEANLACPMCGNVMEVMTTEHHATPSNYLRICPVCASLAWNNEDGTVETRAPQKVDGEELEELTRDM